MPINAPVSAPPPRKPTSAPRPKSRNIVTPAVDVEKLKSSNESREPGVEKKNVKFLFGLLEQASNEREQLLKQLAEKDDTIAMISQQRQLEESSFRKVLTSERKKFDKKILDARNMLQRREDMLRQWSEIGASSATNPATEKEANSESDEQAKIVALLKRTCKIIPDALDSAQKQQLNIGSEKEEEVNEENNQEDDFADEIHDIQENENDNEQHDMDENSIGGHTMSGSILLGDSPTKGKSTKKAKSGKVDRRLNMGSGVLDDESVTTHNLKTISISDLAAEDGINRLHANEQSDSMQFHTISNASAPDKTHNPSNLSVNSAKKVSGLSSSSHCENTNTNTTTRDDPRHKKAGFTPNKKLESASVDVLSDSSSKKYWWDHLVDDSCSDEKIKGESGTADLVLGSRLDKGDRKSGTSNSNKNDEDDSAEVDEDKNKDDSSADGVMSLCSDDFKFSNSTNL
mmetsp:Transcript_27351/g.51070  ORF Transcript_27351/g.51070 Transcript_27351/m.51070 type:complete len:459 (-) Transcript_27351:1917-3293(-)|eukprot:CAMPEP_0114422194 /NCGR_PEP_ID=MMETSP0103-20121206/5481_1 /TAXON_ID=37642 ORGANISM="Paraphysomonas imperforata, Strain PA2" /NCGR_SAMPLE_ID=MMETSP0103 /ASSEMBLY_ACC=CAM_ASM_000201 /LENGTH=458 /DNA_ID=CAMNT_0001590765 /DNA_START=160 /DNA_END=1536 /DNA_ORIENTATION=+